MPATMFNGGSTGTSFPTGKIFTGAKLVLPLSNGNVICIVPSPRSNTEIKVFEFAAARTATPTLRATITAPVTFDRIVGASYSNNDISILVRDTAKTTIRHCKMTYATYAVSAWDTAFSTSGSNVIETWDADVSDGNCVVLACNVYDGSSSVDKRVYTRTSGGTWTKIYDTVITSGAAIARSCDAVGVVCLGVSGGVRDVVVAHASGKSGTDVGVQLATIRFTESTGAISGTYTLRATYMSGEASTSAPGTSGDRLISLYRTNTNEYTAMIMHSSVNNKIGVTRGTFNAGTWASTVALSTSSISSSGKSKLGALATTANNTGQFTFAYKQTTSSQGWVGNFIAKISGSTVTWSTDHRFGTPSYSVLGSIASLGNRNLAQSKSDLYTWEIQPIDLSYPERCSLMWTELPTQKIVSTVPTTSIDSANPVLSASVDLDTPRGHSKFKIQFQFAQDSGFTTSLVDYVQPDSKYDSVVGSDVTGVVTRFDDVLPNTWTLTGTPQYFRARLLDEYGNAGPWTTYKSLILGHPPTAVLIDPKGGQLYVYGTGSIPLKWIFTDPSATDYQTAYQVIGYDAAFAVIFDTGKVVSSAKEHVHSYSAGVKDTQISWIVKLWDSIDSAGNFTNKEPFVLTDAPTATITAPTSGSTVATGVPTITVDLTAFGGRTIKEYTVSVLKAGVVVWSKRVASLVASPVTVSHKVDPGYLLDGESYTAQVTVIDSRDLMGSSILVPFTVDWVPPASPSPLTINTVLYNTEDEGYISIVWDDLSREVNYFTGWNVYRKDDQIDPVTKAVVEEGTWNLIYSEYAVSAGYEYKDYYAPSNYKVSYLVTQKVNRDGHEIESKASTNLVPNPSFEVNTTGWAANLNCTIARSTAQAHVGTASLAMTSAAAGTMSVLSSGGLSGFPVTGELSYTLQARYRAATVARNCAADVYWYTSAGVLISAATLASVADTTTGWTQAKDTATAPANAAFSAVQLRVSNTGAAGEVHYADAVMVEQGSVASTYLDSSNTAVVYPVSDGYWLIEPDSDDVDADAFKLSSVTSDSFTDEQEESEVTVLGIGRTVQKGEKLGVKGTLEIRIRNNGVTTARQKRLRLKKIQEVNGQLWLRNPFGDTFRVNVSSMSISRISGVGASEFCDVTIPYSEVGRK